VVLDFDGVILVGQGFVDEVFRVFATAHPQVQLTPVNMTAEVARLVRLFAPHLQQAISTVDSPYKLSQCSHRILSHWF
jgi:hypothetical protein